jgi:hypothetical protein
MTDWKNVLEPMVEQDGTRQKSGGLELHEVITREKLNSWENIATVSTEKPK